ncbi:MAG: hypothetical protein ACK6DP_12370 [Gemmatimonas sp.]|jgi:hypothetical protein|uniref:hypothetical protein n=1 Tax=Gemmatimonas sp. TaxID=1962908 RepID=UPI00391EF6AD
MAKLGTLKLKTKANEGATMIVRDPFGEANDDSEFPPLLAEDGTPATITLLGADSDAARRYDHQRAAEAQNRLYASAFGKAKKSVVVTPEDIAAQAQYELDKLVALTVGWHGFEDDEGQPLAFTADAVRELYAQNPFVREQALGFIMDRARFFGPSSTPSAPSSSTTSA